MRKYTKILLTALLFALLPLRQFAQQPYRFFADDGLTLNFFEIDVVDFRLYLLYNLERDDRFAIIPEEENGMFVVSPSDDSFDGNFGEAFDMFYNNLLADFDLLSKNDRYDLVPIWKAAVTPAAFTSITMDIAMRRATTVNNHCIDSDPFCTSDVITFEAASTSQTADQLELPGVFDQGCIGSSYNPSWYHMRINTGGQFIIHMEGHDPNTYANRDIDFCIWGPFDDPTSPCVAQLTTSKIIDCNYSSSYSEDIYLGYPAGEHVHQASHQTINEHMPEVGEYYILMICNFSQQPCTISFTKTEGSGPGTTDCGILPGIATNDGPYCVGDDINLSVNAQAGATYAWTGPNGFSSTQQNPVITNCTYAMGGEYVCVTTVDNQTTTGTTVVVIFPEPVASFSSTAVCEGTATQLTSTSNTEPAGYELSSYHWDFGDGETAEGASAAHTYASAGTYSVTHTVSTGSGRCTDEITQEVVVYAIPAISTSANPVSVDYGGTATITANVEPAGNYTYHWEPENMVTNPNSQTTQTVGLIETQVYTCTVTSILGNCTSTEQVTVVMGGSNMTATASVDQSEICQGSSTTLHAHPINGTHNYTYSWSPANLLSSTTEQNPVATPPVGTTTFSCVVSDGIVEQTVSVDVTVYPNVEKDIEAAICENGSYDFYGRILTEPGLYHHTLQTSHGCDSVLNLTLGTYEIESSDFTVGDDENCDEYYWDDGGLEIVETDHEGLTYNASGTYHRTYLNRHGCDSVVTMRVHFDYTPDPTPIYPMDPDNTAPHWVVSSTEFQINTYDFRFWDNNPLCNWDTVRWEFESEVEWVLEPFGQKAKQCKMYVLNHLEDTVWLRATAYNRCEPDNGVSRRYWFVCSFYGIDEDSSSNSASFDVVPNPNNGQMTIIGHDLRQAEVFNTLGQRVATANGEGDTLHIDISDQPAGLYFINVTDGKGRKCVKKMVKE